MSYDGSSIEIIVSWKLSCTILLGLGLMKVFLTVKSIQNSSSSWLMKWFLHFKGDSQRSSRNKKGDLQPSKCEQCEVTFPSKKELVLHNSKKCKSHQCEKCQKYYANERTLQSHSCEEEPIKGSLILESFSLWQGLRNEVGCPQNSTTSHQIPTRLSWE